jgi:hypothetical protein
MPESPRTTFLRGAAGNRPWPLLVLTAAGGAPGDAVRSGDIRTYRVPRDPVVASTERDRDVARPPTRPSLRFELPEGWTDRGGSGMRLATLAVGDPDLGHEVTVIPAAGSLRSNVERWQGQLGGQDPVRSAAAIDQALAEARTVDVDGTSATVVLLLDEAAATDEQGEAILGAMVPLDDSAALFVKFKGDAAIARQQHDNFVRFVASLRWK